MILSGIAPHKNSREERIQKMIHPKMRVHPQMMMFLCPSRLVYLQMMIYSCPRKMVHPKMMIHLHIRRQISCFYFQRIFPIIAIKL